MRDQHVKQLDGSRCQGKNCACASGAMAVFFATRGKYAPTAADFRARSGVSCIPGRSTPSGGINIDAVKRVCKSYGVTINYNGGSPYLKRWTAAEGAARLGSKFGAVFLGDYDQLRWPWRASTGFQGDHSVFVHDYRVDKGDSHYHKIQPTVCWHDPLRSKPIRIPWSVAVAYWQKPGGMLRGFAGFVLIPPIGQYARPLLDRTRTAFSAVTTYRTRTKGATPVRTITPKGRLVQVAMYATGAQSRGTTRWAALDLLGNEWVEVTRLTNVGGTT